MLKIASIQDRRVNMYKHVRRIQTEAKHVKQAKQTNKKSRLGFLGKHLHMQPKAWHACVGLTQNPNPQT